MPDISPRRWGPDAWRTIERFVVNYEPNAETRHAAQLISWVNAFEYVLPCAKCRSNWPQVLKKYPLTVAIVEGGESQRRAWFQSVRAEVRKHESGGSGSGGGSAEVVVPWHVVSGLLAAILILGGAAAVIAYMRK